MILTDMKKLKTVGSADVILGKSNMRISSHGKAALASERFSTTADCVRVALSAHLTSGAAALNIYGYTDGGDKKLYRTDALTLGENEISYEYDPINLAVYQSYESFSAEIELDEEAQVTVVSFSVSTACVSLDLDTESAAEKSDKSMPVPNKMLFIGNSLVFGMQLYYGMCASAPDKDYFHYVTEYVRGKNPECVFEKLHGSSFEASESLEAFESWYCSDINQYTRKPSGESFTEDLDLIIIQLGDNINTDAKNETFKVSGDMLIERIKKASPNARLIWMHGWYTRQPTFGYITSLCERWGIECVDIRSLRSIESEAHTQSTFIDKEGNENPVKDTWKTHPGDVGMKLIAKRLIEQLGF